MISTHDNVKEFLRLQDVIEQSEAKADEVKATAEAARWRQTELAAEAVDGGMTRTDYARAVKKAQSTISRYVAAWKRWGHLPVDERPPFADAIATVARRLLDSGSNELLTQSERGRRDRERQVPTRHDDRVEMAAKLMADPEVVRSVLDSQTAAASKVRSAISQENADRRREAKEWSAQRAQDEALPLPAMWTKIVIKLGDWSMELAGLHDDLDDLPDGPGRDSVAQAAARLADQAQRWVDKLTDRPDLTVIEGTAHERRMPRALIGRQE